MFYTCHLQVYKDRIVIDSSNLFISKTKHFGPTDIIDIKIIEIQGEGASIAYRDINLIHRNNKKTLVLRGIGSDAAAEALVRSIVMVYKWGIN